MYSQDSALFNDTAGSLNMRLCANLFFCHRPPDWRLPIFFRLNIVSLHRAFAFLSLKEVMPMKILISCFISLLWAGLSFAQSITALWNVASFTDPCTEVNAYRYIYPGPVSFDSSGNLVWMMRDRSSCRQPYNNFTVLKVTPKGSPLLSDFKKYQTSGDAGNYYYELLTAHGGRGYWVGSSYAQDSAKSLIVIAVDLKTTAILWTKIWKPAGLTTYTPVAITATDDAIYISANASIVTTEPFAQYYYAMVLAKLDASGKEQWKNIYEEPFYQYYRGNIIVTDSLVYACAYKYSDIVPYYRGQGFIGAYRVGDGILADSFYFAKKRPLSEYDPMMIATDGKQIVACGTNPTTADAAIFNARFSMHLDSMSFSSYSVAPYGYLLAAEMDTNGFLYTVTTEYQSSLYKTGLNVFNCRNGIRSVHRNIELDPSPTLNGVYMTIKDGAIYMSMTTYSSDTTLIGFNRYDANLLKFDGVPLGVNGHSILSRPGIEIYPHPIRDHATCVFGKDLENGEFQIIDALGRTLRNYAFLHGTEFLFERGSLASGIYFYRLSDNGNIIATGKMAVE